MRLQPDPVEAIRIRTLCVLRVRLQNTIVRAAGWTRPLHDREHRCTPKVAAGAVRLT